MPVSIDNCSVLDNQKRPQQLFDVCNETLLRHLNVLAKTNDHPIEHAAIAADFRSKILLMAISLPDRFEVLKTLLVFESGDVEYPIVALLDSGTLEILCSKQTWTGFFTHNGRGFRADLKVKDEVVYQRTELLKCVLEARRREKKERQKIEAERRETTDEYTKEVDDTTRARKNKKAREKCKRQRARRKEEAEREIELERLEREVKQDGITLEELRTGCQLVEVRKEDYFDVLVRAKKLGLKVIDVT